TGDGVVRIYFGTRNAEGRSSIGFLVVDMDDPLKVLHVAEEPALAAGAWGMFDDNGVYPGCLIQHEGKLKLYYMGRSNGEGPLYYMAIGLAEGRDGGTSFERVRIDPVMSRGPHDPWMVSTPFVLRRGLDWVMWYLSGIGWTSIDPPAVRYNIKVASSAD